MGRRRRQPDTRLQPRRNRVRIRQPRLRLVRFHLRLPGTARHRLFLRTDSGALLPSRHDLDRADFWWTATARAPLQSAGIDIRGGQCGRRPGRRPARCAAVHPNHDQIRVVRRHGRRSRYGRGLGHGRLRGGGHRVQIPDCGFLHGRAGRAHDGQTHGSGNGGTEKRYRGPRRRTPRQHLRRGGQRRDAGPAHRGGGGGRC